MSVNVVTEHFEFERGPSGLLQLTQESRIIQNPEFHYLECFQSEKGKQLLIGGRNVRLGDEATFEQGVGARVNEGDTWSVDGAIDLSSIFLVRESEDPEELEGAEKESLEGFLETEPNFVIEVRGIPA